MLRNYYSVAKKWFGLGGELRVGHGESGTANPCGEQVLLHVLLVLNSVAPVRPFSVIYLHTGAEEPPELGALLKDAYELVELKHRHNLHRLYLLHPGWWTRVRHH